MPKKKKSKDYGDSRDPKDFGNELSSYTSKKYKVLTREEEKDLIVLAQSGDKKAIDKLLKHNLGLIFSIIPKFRNRGLPDPDLFQEGTTGFLRALEKFDLSKGFKLSTYATWWISQRMSRAIANKSRTIRIPIHIQDRITKVKWAHRKYIEDYQETPTSEEIAHICNITVKEAEELWQYIDPISSLDQTVGDEENLSVLSYIPSEESSQPEVRLEKVLDKAYIRKIVYMLPLDEQKLILLKYGLIDDIEKTKTELAEILCIQPAEVVKLEAKALQRLKSLIDLSKLNLNVDDNRFEVALGAVGPNKMEVIEKLKELFGFTLTKISEVVKNLPTRVVQNLTEDQANLVILKLRSCGAEVILIENT